MKPFSEWTPADVAAHNARVAGQIPVAVPAFNPVLATVDPARTSSDESKLNKLERSWLAVLRSNREIAWIGIQNVTLKLADDCRYTPDFIAVGSDGGLTAHEVKGPQFWDDAKVKLKVAARSFPWIKFALVRRATCGAFKCEEVKP